MNIKVDAQSYTNQGLPWSDLTISKGNIKDVELIKLTVNADDRGYLIKDITKDITVKHKILEHYLVINPQPMIRGFHLHYQLWDFFSIIQGRAKFILIDARTEIDGKRNESYGKYMEFILTDKLPTTIIVPPGVFHGWQSLDPNTILSSSGSEWYDSTDEMRINYNSFLNQTSFWTIDIK